MYPKETNTISQSVCLIYRIPNASHGESESESKVAQSCLTLCNPLDYSLLGSSIHGIFQARVLEWGAIAFSKEASS